MKVKTSIFSLNPDDIREFVYQNNERPYRAKQLINWIFVKRVFYLDEMSNLPKDFKNLLNDNFNWDLPKIISKLESEDGTTKLLLKTSKDQAFETVILRYENRTALCVSSQIGCKLSCSFCQTGKLGFFRHLTAGEILSQFCLAESLVKEENRTISNVVFMGMGEPLDNFTSVVKTVNTLINPEGFGLSHRKVTVSTSGIAPKIIELSKQTRTALAVSLHACRDDLRSQMMPINRRYPLGELKEAIKLYQKVTNTKITFEYILIKDLNCGLREAKELVKFAQGIPCKINLIPFNDHPGIEYKRPEDKDINIFQKYLLDRGLVTTVRYSKGLEVSAACGQLAAKNKLSIFKSPKRQSITNSIQV